MEKVTSPRSRSWLAEPGLALHLPRGSFSWYAHGSLSFCGVGGGSTGDALWRRPVLWRKIPVGLGLSAKCSTGAQRPEQEDANLVSGLGSHPEWATGTLAAPMSQAAGTFPTRGEAQSDADQSWLSPFGPSLLTFAFPVAGDST